MLTDETTGAVQGASSEQQGGNTPTEESPTLTASQARQMADEAARKAKSDMLAELGRAKADLQRTQKLQERLSKMEEELQARELESARDNPDRLSQIRQKHREQKERADLMARIESMEAEKAELTERAKRAEAYERQEMARDIAKQFGIKPDLLAKYGTDRDSMIELAKSLPKVGTGEEGQGSQQVRETHAPDSGRTKGSSGSKKLADLLKVDTRNMSYPDLLQHKQDLEAAMKAER